MNRICTPACCCDRSTAHLTVRLPLKSPPARTFSWLSTTHPKTQKAGIHSTDEARQVDARTAASSVCTATGYLKLGAGLDTTDETSPIPGRQPSRSADLELLSLGPGLDFAPPTGPSHTPRPADNTVDSALRIPQSMMNGSQQAQEPAPQQPTQPPAASTNANADSNASASANGNSTAAKKRKKDGLKPIITTETPPGRGLLLHNIYGSPAVAIAQQQQQQQQQAVAPPPRMQLHTCWACDAQHVEAHSFDILYAAPRLCDRGNF
ncbi:hypothetical protein CSUB01_00011 [Colletotrichum sublineola]|uniref:Uncharacterized protein n=1 Tax=Colletotrichum sublineola TaxID=1173701 RepID=A0A066XSW7_COLSU|nr:hypothetical protein CSUB01_00011 [Colletotrichum sublineola]